MLCVFFHTDFNKPIKSESNETSLTTEYKHQELVPHKGLAPLGLTLSHPGFWILVITRGGGGGGPQDQQLYFSINFEPHIEQEGNY